MGFPSKWGKKKPSFPRRAAKSKHCHKNRRFIVPGGSSNHAGGVFKGGEKYRAKKNPGGIGVRGKRQSNRKSKNAAETKKGGKTDSTEASPI